jgi:hypothetical protein
LAKSASGERHIKANAERGVPVRSKEFFGIIIVAIIAAVGTIVVALINKNDDNECKILESKFADLRREAASSTQPHLPSLKATIHVPKENDLVEQWSRMEGVVVGDAKNAHLWVLTKANDSSHYYPQGREIRVGADGKWTLPDLRIGTDSIGVGVSHEVVLVHVTEITHKAFLMYFEMGDRCGKWEGFRQIAGTQVLANVSVVRK